jgi:hypothetical protein
MLLFPSDRRRIEFFGKLPSQTIVAASRAVSGEKHLSSIFNLRVVNCALVHIFAAWAPVNCGSYGHWA